jgi:hypothetical protein
MKALLGLFAIFVTSACGGGGDPVTAYFAVPGSSTGDDFYALPFPNDVWRTPDGTLDLSQLPTNSPIADTVKMIAQQDLDGFGLSAALFARFSGPLDQDSLPSPAASVQDDASVYVVDVDPDSPYHGQRTPVIATFHDESTQTMGPNRLAVRPYPGFPLHEGTTYALVMTNRMHARSGGDVRPDTDWTALLGGATAAATPYAPLFAWLDEPGGDERDDVVSAAVFTTQHATQIGSALRKGVFATPAPVGSDIMNTSRTSAFSMWKGTYEAPNFQHGDPPYLSSGGQITVDASGTAEVQRTESLRFALSVPEGPVPANGFPICIYQHGTGGDWVSFYNDGTAEALANQGIAVISTDQVLHGPRNPSGTDPEIAFFNLSNLYAGRDNPLQGAADAWSQMRLALGLGFADGARTITFDADKVFFFGHSQGGLTGPAFIAFEPNLKGAVLSGTGGVLYLSLLNKTEPVNFPDLVTALVRDEPVDEDNPSLALAQMAVERSDGINYAPMFARELPTADGVTQPKNIYQTEGFTDHYSPNAVIEAFATAVGGDQVDLPDTKPLEGVALRGRSTVAPPITDNVHTDGGDATIVLAQFNQAGTSDGHFVLFNVPAARKQSSEFLGTLPATGHATVVSP